MRITGTVLCFLLIIGSAKKVKAQGNGIAVKGKVTDKSGKTLPGVNVIVKGTSNGTSTNSKGLYHLSASSLQDTLRFSFIGYKTMFVPIDGRSVINITLSKKTISGQEVVVVGYGSQKRQNVNGAVSTVSSEDIKNSQDVSVSQLLQGQASGVEVTQNSGEPGGAASVRIRGTTSITGNNEPLYVIDGVPVSGDANNTATSGLPAAFSGSQGGAVNTVSPLSTLNPNDIESISVLKDASAEAIYGSRGANGVVIITTKSGQAGHNEISYNGYIGFQEPQKLLKVMNLRQYARLQNDLSKIQGSPYQPLFARPGVLGEGTNWQEAIYNREPMQSNQLSFSGGNNNINYYVSGGNLNKKGIVLGSKFNRYTIQTHINAHVTDWLKAGVKANGSTSNRNLPITGSTQGAVALALREPPSIGVYNSDGTFAGPPENGPNTVFTQGNINPVAEALRISNTLQRNKLLGSLYAEATLIKGLTFKSSFGGSFQIDKANHYTPTYSWGRFVNTVPTANYRRETSSYWDFRNYFTYDHTFPGENQITLMVGQEAQKSMWEGLTAGGKGFVTDLHTLNLAQSVGKTNGGYSGEYTMVSYYSRLIYSLEEKYSLTASIRADGSSKFAEGHRWGYFPAISGSWKIYKEPFMQGFDNYINRLTLKVGYGITGNQDIGNFLYNSSLTAMVTGVGTGFAVGNIANPNLKWELQKQLNLGISFGLFNDRFNATVEAYSKVSSRFLYQLPLPDYLTGGSSYLGGVSPPYVNLGSMENKGIDITLGYQTKPSKDFSWSSKLTVSHNNNKVKALYNSDFNITENVNSSNGNQHIVTKTVEGKPIGLFYGYKVKGIFNDESTIRDQPPQFGEGFDSPSDTLGSATPMDSTWLGDIQYVDVNGDGVINSKDRTFIGNPHPDFTFGFHNTFDYKNISLSVFLQGSVGNDILNINKREIISAYGPGINQLEAAADFWTPKNRDAKYPRPRPSLDNPNNFISSRFVEDGSYVRLKNVKLGYSLPVRITHNFDISRINIYGSVTNLWTITGYSGYEPDVGAINQNALLQGIDNGRYPAARIFTLGVNIRF